LAVLVSDYNIISISRFECFRAIPPTVLTNFNTTVKLGESKVIIFKTGGTFYAYLSLTLGRQDRFSPHARVITSLNSTNLALTEYPTVFLYFSVKIQSVQRNG
jgi:hypothetical protein